MTNGSVIEISYTGTTIIFKPGIIIGGTFTHKCPTSRAIGYFVEPLLLVAPFAKKPLTATFHGVTSSDTDIGVDTIRTSIFPVLQKFGIDREELRIVRRGAAPLGGGEVVLHMPHLVLQPKTLHATDSPQITKIRGVAYSTRISPASVNRIIDSARDVLRATKSETYIYSDVAKGEDSGKSPGFGVTLVAEAKNGWCYSADGVGSAGSTPEDLGNDVALKLLEEVSIGGVFGRNQLPLAVVLMVLGKEDVGRLAISKEAVDAKFIRLLRLIKTMWGIEALIQDGEKPNECVLVIKGSGFVSASKKIA